MDKKPQPVARSGRPESPVAAASLPLSGRAQHRALVKVPEITVWFWVAKVMTTGMGETTSDFLVHALDPVLALACGGVGLSVSLFAQLAVRRFVPWIYWGAVLMVSVFGTMAADAVHVVLGIPYLVSVASFLAALTGVFWLWYRTEGTLSIHSVDTRRREGFYWAAVLTTFALGTAVGDFTAYTLGMGYLLSGILFGAVIGVAALAYRRRWMAAVPAFWFVYILTRPLGASFADWTAVPGERGGLGWGTGAVSLALAGGIAVVVAYFSRRDKRPDALTEASEGSVPAQR